MGEIEKRIDRLVRLGEVSRAQITVRRAIAAATAVSGN